MSEKIYEFNIEKFNFEFLIKKIFNTEKDLENFHLLLPENERIEEVNFENDNETWFHKKFYEKLNNSWDEFDILYHSFVEESIKPIFKKEKIIYQKRPTFRIQLPNNKSVGEFHRDYDYNHQLGEINFVVALTDMKDTTAIWAESIPGLGDIHPLNVEKGNFLAFNGNMCTHGNKINTSNKTRVSFDFRVISEEFYKSDFDKKSTGKSIPMTIGGYDIPSSYSENNIGQQLKEIILTYKPKKVVEFGVLNGYSTIHMAQALKEIGEGHVYAYDLWEKYPYRHSTKEKVLENLKKYKVENYVSLEDGDIFEWIEKKENFDLIHVDISNDGEKIQKIYNSLRANKNSKNSIMLFEGGTKERDQIEWMVKYNKEKIYPLLQSGQVPYKIISEKFPGLSMVII